jgi:UDP-N-acetylmuramoylalanine--D-glutamate ligase
MARHLTEDKNLVSAIVMGATAPAIEDSLRKAGMKAIARVESLKDAVSNGVRLLSGDGTLLLSPACASFDMFRDFEQRGDRFREIVQGYPGVVTR